MNYYSDKMINLQVKHNYEIEKIKELYDRLKSKTKEKLSFDTYLIIYWKEFNEEFQNGYMGY